uniref:Neurotransmitter-gated ion-channel ligand-binding domain-containing protein n=2 Tax=Arion vulgaris TaxID=1028688 RepID=A0A0B7A008_9EUPU
MAQLLFIGTSSMTFHCTCVIFLFLLTQTKGECFNEANCTGGAEEMKMLHKKLLKDYVPEVRPSRFYNTSTKINVELHLSVVMGLDTKQQLVYLRAFFRFSWIDEYLQWNSTDYGGIERILVLQNNIWKPDVIIENAADEHDMLGGERVFISVNSDGLAKWEPPFYLQGTCKLDMSKYPFDKSICPVTITSWMTDNQSTNIQWTGDPVNLDSMMINGEYDISSAGAVLKIGEYEDQFFETVTFRIKLARRPVYSIISLLIPLNLLAVLGILSFMMPPKEPEKVAISVTILLSFTVFLSIIENNIPPTSDTISLLVIYVSALLVMSFLSVVGNILVVTIKCSDESDERKHIQARSLENILGQHNTAAVLYKNKPESNNKLTHSLLDTNNCNTSPCIFCTKAFDSAQLKDKPQSSNSRANKLNKYFMIISCVAFVLISCFMVVLTSM